MLRGLLIIIFTSLLLSSYAQEENAVMSDSVVTVVETAEQDTVSTDTVSIESYARRYNPRKALFFSAVVPGMGQVYNKRYWKVPIVYGGLILGAYVVNTYQIQYLQYKSELFSLLNNPVPPISESGYNQEQLRSIINKTRRQRDYFSILTAIWYMLQIMDAHVDAHLKEFDLNPQLQVKVEPMVESNELIGRNSGVSLKLKF
ncbi:MAG TPA: DUF5683 domain-containing protein [Cyclobacteriaceae bacterium]